VKNAELGERVNYGVVWIEDAKDRPAEKKAGDQLSDYRRLLETLRENTENLCSDKQRDEGNQQMRERVLVHVHPGSVEGKKVGRGLLCRGSSR
jgi:hypothetical protein